MNHSCPLAQRALQHPHELAIQKGDHQLTWLQLHELTDQVISDLFGSKDPLITPDLFGSSDQKIQNDPRIFSDQKIQNDPEQAHWIAVHQCDPIITIVLLCAAFRSNRGIFFSSDRDPIERSDDIIAQLPVYRLFRGIGSFKDLFGSKDPLSTPDHFGSSDQKIHTDPRIFSDQKIQNDPPSKRSEKIRKDPYKIQKDQPTFLLQTSGSTTHPKLVVHSLNTLLASAEASKHNIPFQIGDRWLLSLALWHIGGLAIFFRALCGGATVIVPDSAHTLAENIHRHHITHLSVVALQLQRILDSQIDVSSLKHVLVGGGPIPEVLIQSARHANIPVYTTYGMTELGSQLCTTGPNASLKELTTAGRPLKGWSIKIDETGEICAQGTPLFLGYLTPNGLHNVRDSQGWFHTGDLGTLHEDGSLKVLGRKDAQFISGGENIYPEEIEKVLSDFPTIKLAIVVPIPNMTYGQRPLAFILGEFSPSELHTHLLKYLPSFKHPDIFLPWPPQIAPHKPSRSALRLLALAYNQPKPQSPSKSAKPPTQ